MNRSSALPPLHNIKVGRTYACSEASSTESSSRAHQQAELQQKHFMRVARLFSLPSQPEVVSKLVADLVAIQLARQPAAPYLMALVQVSFPAALQYLDCLTDHYYGSILVMMHHVFEQEATKHLATEFEQLLPHVNWDVEGAELSAVTKSTSTCQITTSGE